MVKVADLNLEKTVQVFEEPERFFDLEDEKNPKDSSIYIRQVIGMPYLIGDVAEGVWKNSQTNLHPAGQEI
jgi:hypothetical protein